MSMDGSVNKSSQELDTEAMENEGVDGEPAMQCSVGTPSCEYPAHLVTAMK